MRLGTLRSIQRYPIKSLRGEVLEACPVLPSGLADDRSYALLAGEGRPRAHKAYRGKDDARLHLFGTAHDVIAAVPEEALWLAPRDDDERYFDDAPVSLIFDRWLDGVSSYVGYRVEAERFRPNFFVEADDDFTLNEAELTGRELELGEVTLRVRYPIERCVVTTYDPAGGPADPRVLRYLAQARSAWMGIYCDVPRAGIARIGDSLELVER